MAMYPEENKQDEKKPSVKQKEYIELHCAECDKFCGFYFRVNPTFFKELFFCTLKCQSDHIAKKNKNGKLSTD